MKLILEIELGNDAMLAVGDVREVMNAVKFTGHFEHMRASVTDRGTVRDVNGNRVGKWEVIGDPQPTPVSNSEISAALDTQD